MSVKKTAQIFNISEPIYTSISDTYLSNTFFDLNNKYGSIKPYLLQYYTIFLVNFKFFCIKNTK